MMLTSLGSPKSLNQRFYSTLVAPEIEELSVQLVLNAEIH